MNYGHTARRLRRGSEYRVLALRGKAPLAPAARERKAKAVARARNVTYSIIQVAPFQGYLAGKVTYEHCLRLLEKIAIAVGTDLAVLNALKAAVSTLERERKR